MSHLFDSEEELNLTKKIEGLQCTLAEKKSRKNDLIPISRLPEEVLSTIISYSKWLPDMRYRYIRKMPQIWMCALVSKRWYRIVTSSPYMWDTVNANWTFKKIKTWFSRSKAARLRVWMDEALKGRDSMAILGLISTEFSRIRSLQIITSAALMDNWRQVLDQEAPVIEAFSLHITYPQQYDYDCELNVTFPTSYFHGRPPPLLREFEFGGPHIIWTSPHLCNLTRLRIQGHYRSNRPHVPLAQVLRSLEHLPFLRYLDATDEAFPDDDNNPQGLVVTVSRLKSLRFRGGFERWCPLFTYLLLPFATEIDLRSTSQDPSAVDTLLDHLAVYFHHKSGSADQQNKFDSVVMHQDEGGLRLQAECVESTGRSPLSINLKSTTQREEVYIKFAAIVPVSRATKLYLTGSMPNPSQWKGIERAMVSLTVLRLGGEACGTFPHAILRVKHLTLPFMHLLRIEIEKAPFPALIAADGLFWEGMGRSIVAVLESQVVRKPGGEHLSVVRFLACSGEVDDGFARLLEGRGIKVRIS